MNQLWGRDKKPHEISLGTEHLAGIPLQEWPTRTKKVFAPGCICLEWENPDIDVDVMINKESILNWH